MEELQKAAVGLVKDSKIRERFNSYSNTNTPSSSASSTPPPPPAALSQQSSHLLLTRPPRYLVSGWTCSKLCGICFIAGVVVGYTLKRRVRNWASKLLRRLKDD